jgi:beta-galactosidase/beta-glucuronidase
MKSLTRTVTITIAVIILTSCKENKVAMPSLNLSGAWLIKSSLQVSEQGNKVSTGNFRPVSWYPATVPTTVLNALIKNKVYPDPFVGLNNYKIPDVSDEFNARYNLARYSYIDGKTNPWKDPYWFRKEFFLTKEFEGKQIWLNFDGINYRADVWVNGQLVAEKKDMAGMFLRFRYDISKYAMVNDTNYLAVKIYQVDHPGVPTPGTQFEVFGKTRGHASDLFKDETLKFSGGWDCAPVIRDRNMGIYQDVYITSTGPVSIDNPAIVTDLPLPDTSMADLKISTDLKNSTQKKISGKLTVKISIADTVKFPSYYKIMGVSMEPLTLTTRVSLEPGESINIKLEPDKFPLLRIRNPHLWWPNGYGKQYLHKMELSFSINKEVSDKKTVSFGIREITNEVKKLGKDYGRIFYVNGQKVFCKGGWLQPDALLNTNEKKVYDEARLLAIANVNMVANEDAPAAPDMVLDSYDKYGLMYWETFYQCWRMYPGDTATQNNPLDHTLALREAADIIKRYRNHPSLVLWCAANEVTVAEDIYKPLRKLATDLDGTRPFLAASSTSWDIDKYTPYIKPDLPLGTTDDGDPDYNWNPEHFYFDKIIEDDKQAFRNELGVASVPVYSSLRKFIPVFSKDVKNPIFPLDSTWAEHGAWDDNNYAFRAYDNAIRTLYGKPTGVADYARKAQFVNANSYRAMFEAANHRMWDLTCGVMLWKLNDCWPSVLWQLYDWYLCQNAAYFYAQKAMEPVHIQMNANSHIVSVINTRHQRLDSMTVSADIFDFNMKKLWSVTRKTGIGPDTYSELFKIPGDSVEAPVYFVILKLKTGMGKTLSENIYWQSNTAKPDFSAISHLQPVAVGITGYREAVGKEQHFTITLSNNTDKLSFFSRLIFTIGADGEEILPVFWDNNFITLFPGEECTVKAIIETDDLRGKEPYLSIDGNDLIKPVMLSSKQNDHLY